MLYWDGVYVHSGRTQTDAELLWLCVQKSVATRCLRIMLSVNWRRVGHGRRNCVPVNGTGSIIWDQRMQGAEQPHDVN